jgi:hypothetical protein
VGGTYTSRRRRAVPNLQRSRAPTASCVPLAHVTGGEVVVVFDSRESHERVVHRTARDPGLVALAAIGVGIREELAAAFC